jgi:hypothetical protein
MHILARRVFRLSATMALSLACAYGMQAPLPFLAPLFALLLTSNAAPPMGLKALVGLLLLALLTLGAGLLLIPALVEYPLSGVLLVGMGLYLSAYITVNMGKALIGTFLTVGFTLISAAGTLSSALATTVIQSLALSIVLAVLCHRVVYPLFPEDSAPAKPPKDPTRTPSASSWIALRSTLIVLPAYLLALTNPSAYLAIIMKAVTLGRQGSFVNARNAGRELLGSTFLGGCFAVLFWVMLDLLTNLWMFFWLMLIFGVYFSSKIYRVYPSRYPASFWINVATTMLILLGPAVEDSANGKDVYAAFFIRMGLFVTVTLYAWLAIYFLEWLRARRLSWTSSPPQRQESPTC